ncbi:hypothetical protein [Azospirillum halopraeferens]|uniref:hypothetical protein n=1 Tax=Azospirillum halopraeferens TaxID=34010 RepID=UPI0004195F55|nr:hypothetical protein [Azospirillum halopraeferens]
MAATVPPGQGEDGCPPAASLADSLTAMARRHGSTPGDEDSLLDVLAAIESRPLIPHALLLVAGSVMAGVFRFDRDDGAPPADPAADPPSADCSF